MKNLMLSTLAILTACIAAAQGTIRGEVKDMAKGTVVPYAKIKVEGMAAGAVSDFDGQYHIELPAGTYTLILSHAEYAEIKQTAVVVNGKVSEVQFQIEAPLKTNDMKSITVSVTRKTATTIAGDDARRRESSNTTDGISREQMKATGDGDAGEVAQRVTGVSVEGGKNIYVRGLGDRYTKTILNGMEIPGLDPERNTVQLDIFPTNLIDNLTVYKTFTPNLAGDFTGGLVDISTRDFPAHKTLSFQAGFASNTVATLNPDFLTYQGGKTDFLGFDDGTRKLPVSPSTRFPDPTLNDSRLSSLTRSFNPIMATSKKAPMLDQNYAFSFGNQLNKKRFDYGYNFVFNYRNNNRMYDDIQFNEFRKPSDKEETTLNPFQKTTGVVAENDVLWTALLGQSFKFNKKHKISVLMFHTMNGKKTASDLRSVNYENNPSTLVKQNLQYNARSVSNAQIAGSHNLNKWKIDWRLAPTISKINDPDIRSTILEELHDDQGQMYYDLNPSVGSEIRRIFRYLTEYNLSGRVDFNYQFTTADSLKNKISFGAMETYKHRDFSIYDYLFQVVNAEQYTADPNYYFQADNIWTSERNSGTYGRGERQLANSFVASQQVTGVYVMHEMPLSKRFELTYGSRVEHAMNKYTGQNNSGTIKYNNEKVLNTISVLPSVNAVYKWRSENHHFTNLRGAYATTVARPSFRENSIAQIYDPIQGRRYNGNIDLKQTTIHNFDLRWEKFFGRTELISASAFYKRFVAPIEIVSFDLAPNEVKPVNAGTADVYGLELEIRKAIGFKRENQKHLSWVSGINFTYVVSKIDMNKVMINKGNELVTEKSLREANARDGETIGNFRPMYGQSPYIINAFSTFKNDSLGLVFNLSYNVQGPRLAVIGVGMLPDVYEQAFHSLNMKVSKVIGKNKLWNASLAAQNLLMSKKTRNYVSFDATNQIYDLYNQGMTISGSISYTLK